MRFTTEKEANRFKENVEAGDKILSRMNEILSKALISAEEKTELQSLNSQLYEINQWFEKTAAY